MDQQLGPANTLPADDNPFASNVLLSPDGLSVALYQPSGDRNSTRSWVVMTSSSGVIRCTSAYVTGWHPLAPMSLSDTMRVQDGCVFRGQRDATQGEAEAAVTAYIAGQDARTTVNVNDVLTVQHTIGGKPIGYVGVTGRERPGEHWNARLGREQAAANRIVAAMARGKREDLRTAHADAREALARRHAAEVKAWEQYHRAELDDFNRDAYGNCTASDDPGATCGEAADGDDHLCAMHRGIRAETKG